MPKSRLRIPFGDWSGGLNEDDAVAERADDPALLLARQGGLADLDVGEVGLAVPQHGPAGVPPDQLDVAPDGLARELHAPRS